MFTVQTICKRDFVLISLLYRTATLTYIYTNSSSHVFTNPESMRQNSLDDFVDSQIQDSWIFMDVNRYHLVRDIKPSAKQLILISQKISQLEQLKKKTNFLLAQNRFFLSFGPMKSWFSFSTCQTEKDSWNKLGKTRMVWCHKQDIRSQIFSK